VHPVDEVLPIPRLAVLGLQHVLIMYTGYTNMPDWFQTIAGSAITTTAIVAFLLNLLFNHLSWRGPVNLGPQDAGVSVDPEAPAPAPSIDLTEMAPEKRG
jgi:xanthine/uracil permease